MIDWMNEYPLLFCAFVIVARIIDVSLGTVRTICVVRGYRALAAVLGFVEVLVWIIAVSGVLVDVTWWKVTAYALGFAAGNAVGIYIEGKLAMGQQMITFLSRRFSHDLAFALRLGGYRVTQIPATGRDGPVTLCLTAVSRRTTDKVLAMAKQVDQDVLAIVEDIRFSSLSHRIDGPPPTGWRTWTKKK